jgi:hypothetical protein
MIPALFYQLLVFAGFACQAPTYGQLKTKSISSFKGMQVNLHSCHIKQVHVLKTNSQRIYEFR